MDVEFLGQKAVYFKVLIFCLIWVDIYAHVCSNDCFLFLLCGFWRLNPSSQVWKQAFFPLNHLSDLLLIYLNSDTDSLTAFHMIFITFLPTNGWLTQFTFITLCKSSLINFCCKYNCWKYLILCFHSFILLMVEFEILMRF